MSQQLKCRMMAEPSGCLLVVAWFQIMTRASFCSVFPWLYAHCLAETCVLHSGGFKALVAEDAKGYAKIAGRNLSSNV